MSHIPVSYTHLDVYKRQGNKCPACDAEFDERVITKLKRKPVVPGMVRKKKKVSKS